MNEDKLTFRFDIDGVRAAEVELNRREFEAIRGSSFDKAVDMVMKKSPVFRQNEALARQILKAVRSGGFGIREIA